MFSVSLCLDGNYCRSTAILNVVVWIVFPQGSCMCVEICNFCLILWHLTVFYLLHSSDIGFQTNSIKLFLFVILLWNSYAKYELQMIWAKQAHGFHVSLGIWKPSAVLLKVKNRIRFWPVTCRTWPIPGRWWISLMPTHTSHVRDQDSGIAGLSPV